MHHHSDRSMPLLLALAVWLCTLPLVGFAVLPLFGVQVAAGVAAALLLLVLLVCWALCWWPAATTQCPDSK